ncbi:hypothetical protein Gorai_023655, partial [Gossypium raimondii]|nr:hypothetical protein [Gossypium raimondii]
VVCPVLVLGLPVTREQTGLDRVFLSHFLLFGNEISFNGKCVDNLQTFDTNTNVICCVVNTYGACPDMRWFPPNVGALKFNVDAAVRGNHGPGIIGGIRQDHEGRTLLIFSRSAGLVEQADCEKRLQQCFLVQQPYHCSCSGKSIVPLCLTFPVARETEIKLVPGDANGTTNRLAKVGTKRPSDLLSMLVIGYGLDGRYT